jgi:hypothetical protein
LRGATSALCAVAAPANMPVHQPVLFIRTLFHDNTFPVKRDRIVYYKNSIRWRGTFRDLSHMYSSSGMIEDPQLNWSPSRCSNRVPPRTNTTAIRLFIMRDLTKRYLL